MSATSKSTELTALRAQVESLQAALAESQKENAFLRQKIDSLVRRVFGASSERIDPAQLELLLGLSIAPEHIVTPKSSPSSPSRSYSSHRPRLPDNLPVVEELVDPPVLQTQPQAWRCIGQEVSEQLDYEPARFLRRRIIRRKYVHRTKPELAPIIAPLPDCLLERGVAAPGLLAQILVSKYCDHLPLYRQEQIFLSRHQVYLPRQTLARWVELAADWLRPIYQHIRTGVLAGGYVQVDETPISYLCPGHGKTKQGYLWACCRPGQDVVFRWETSRATRCLDNLIPKGFSGTIQCDGYGAYRAFQEQRGNQITLAGCWAHLRRKFHEAVEQSPRTAGWILRQLQHLYHIEAQLRGASPKLRAVARASQSLPIVRRLNRALIRLKTSSRPLPQSLLGQAIDYALSQWNTLEHFLSDGRIEVDNNLVENSIRPTAIGKKNWLFIGQAQAGERSAIIYTVIESCRRRGINPYFYLREVLTRLPKMTNHQTHTVTPEAWATEQRSNLRKALP